VTLTLEKPDGSTVITVTDSSGGYTFVCLPPGDYIITEANPPGYPGDLSDYNETPDGDNDDSNTVPGYKLLSQSPLVRRTLVTTLLMCWRRSPRQLHPVVSHLVLSLEALLMRLASLFQT
jgi:hypothetical protein